MLYILRSFIFKLIAEVQQLDSKEKTITYIIFYILSFTILRILFRHFRIKQSGKRGERKVKRILKKYKKDVFVMNDVMLPLYDNYTQIDHLVIGDFGLIVIETKNHSGIIYGDKNAKKWVIKKNLFNKKDFYNPVKQNETHKKTVNYWLKHNHFNVPIDNLVVFTGNVTVKCKGRVPICSPKQLKRYINSYIKNPKTTVEKEAIYNYLKQINVTSKSAKKQHLKFVKSFH
ncbi:MAG: nuclease-related domain-containing protein [Candidatus Woesearchaeota archaeon]